MNYIGNIDLYVNNFTPWESLKLIKNINHNFLTIFFKILANAQFWSWGYDKRLHLILLQSFFPWEDYLNIQVISLWWQDVIKIVLEPKFACSHFWNVDKCVKILLGFRVWHAGIVQFWKKILFQEIALGTRGYVHFFWR